MMPAHGSHRSPAQPRNSARSSRTVPAACLLFVLLLWNISLPCATADNWPGFRGPNGDGIAAESTLPTEWGLEHNILWKAALPGTGWSQPIVWGNKIFVTSAESQQQTAPNPQDWGPGSGAPGIFGILTGKAPRLDPPEAIYRWRIHCLDVATGDVVWERLVREGRPTTQTHSNNTYASETPVTDGERVIAYFGMMGVYCYDFTGELLWTADLGAYPTQFGWGTGSSPALHGDLVYIQCDNDQSSFLVALNKHTGAEAWRVARDEKSNWSTPYLWKNALRTELVTAGGNRIRSYDPHSGELLWEMQGSGRTATTPVGDENLLYVDSYDRLMGRSGIFAAIRPGATGDISLPRGGSSNDFVVWSKLLTGYRTASPLLYQNCLYLLEQQSGIVRCLDAATGKEHARKRLPGATGCTASPIAANGKVYIVDQNSRTSVLEAGPELKVIAANPLDGNMCWASPAVAGNRLLVRNLGHLFCIGTTAGDLE